MVISFNGVSAFKIAQSWYLSTEKLYRHTIEPVLPLTHRWYSIRLLFIKLFDPYLFFSLTDIE
jgi:hypothetical protein